MNRRNLSVFFCAETLALVADWALRSSIIWVAYQVTLSPARLGYLSFATQLPFIAFSILAGVYSDRFSLKRVLIAAHLGLAAGTLALLIGSSHRRLDFLNLLLVGSMSGAFIAIGMTGRQLLPLRELKSMESQDGFRKENNVAGKMSSLMSVTRQIGPALAGFIINFAGETLCFAIVCLAYLLSAVILSRVKTVKPTDVSHESFVRDIREGWSIVSRSAAVRPLLLLCAWSTLLGMPVSIFLPAFATVVLKGGANTYSALLTSSGAGALIVMAVIWKMHPDRYAEISLIGFSVLLGAGWVLFGLSKNLLLSCVLSALTGGSSVVVLAQISTLLHLMVTPAQERFVTSYYSVAFLATAPFGGLLAARLADWVGVQNGVVASGVLYLLVTACFAFRLKTIRESAWRQREQTI